MGNGMIPKVFGSLPKTADTDLDKNENPTGTSLIITYHRKKKMIDIKTFQRKKRKLSCFSLNSREPDKVIQTVQNSSMGEVSVSWSGNSLPLEENKGENNRNDRETKGKLEPVREGCNVFSKGDQEVSITERKMEEIPHSSCDGNVIKDVVSVRSINFKTFQRKKRKSPCFSLNSMEPDKVIQTVQNTSMGEVSVSWSGNSLPLEENKGENNRNDRETKGKLEPVREGCNVFSKGDLEVSITERKMEEIPHSSCDGNVIKDVSVRSINFKTFQRKKRKSPCFSLNSMEPDKVIQTVQNTSMGEVSVSWSGNSLPLEEKKGENNRNDRETKGKLDPVREGCNVFSKGNLEVSITECKMKEILHSSCDGNVIKDVVSVGSVNNKETYILEKLPRCSRRKLLILDLNGLLADIVPFARTGYTPDRKIAFKPLFKRPFCDDFLKFCFDRFEVGVWSSRNKKNVDSVIDFLMGELKHKLLFCWDQSHCTDTGRSTIDNKKKPLVLKELKKLWDKHDPNLPWEKGDYSESNTLLVDDSPYKALCNPPHTAIFPYPFTYLDRKDNSLGPGGDLRVYLEGLATGGDIQKYVGEHPFGQRAITSKNPSWNYYLTAIGTKIFDVQPKDNVDCSTFASSQELCKLSSK